MLVTFVLKRIKLVKKYLSPAEVAELLMVTPTTVRRWSNSGKLNSLHSPGGHRRFLKEDIDTFASEQGISLVRTVVTRRKILVIDDDVAVADLLQEIISDSSDAEVCTVNSGFEAGLKVKAFMPDTIITDIMMPGMDGIAVCKMLKSQPSTRNIRIIGITGYYSEENVNNLLNAGAETCLKKPINIPELLSVLSI
jgi:excisionase family DNA binding protein